MTDKIEKDVKVAKNNKRIIVTTALLLLVVGIVYSASIFVVLFSTLNDAPFFTLNGVDIA